MYIYIHNASKHHFGQGISRHTCLGPRPGEFCALLGGPVPTHNHNDTITNTQHRSMQATSAAFGIQKCPRLVLGYHRRVFVEFVKGGIMAYL